MLRAAALQALLLFLSWSAAAQRAASRQDAYWNIRFAGADTSTIGTLEKQATALISRPGENPADLDSALGIIRQAEQISILLGYSKGIGDCNRIRYLALREKGETDPSKVCIERAIEIYQKTGCYYELAESYHLKGLLYSIDIPAELAVRLELEQKALQAYLKTSSTLDDAGCYRQLGELSLISRDLPNGISYLMQSLALYKENNYKDLHGVYDLISQYHRSVSNFEASIKYGLLAVKTGEAAGDTSIQMCTLYNRLGLSYYTFADLEQSRVCFAKALQYAEKYKDIPSIHFVVPNLAKALHNLNYHQEAIGLMKRVLLAYPPTSDNMKIQFDQVMILIYVALGNVRAAEPYARELLALEDRNGIGVLYQRLLYTGCVQFFIASKRYPEARRYIKKLERFPVLETRTLINLALLRFKIDSATGNYISAIKNLQEYKTLNDSSFNQTKTKQIEHMKIEFESEKKDNEIQMKEKDIRLLVNEKKLHLATISHAQSARNIMIVGMLMSLILVGLLFSRYLIKKRSNALLELKQSEINIQNSALKHLIQEKEWLLKEIHHRVKNNLQIVMSLLSSQSVYLKDAAAVSAIRDSQLRVNSMSLIHQKLYLADNVSSIDMQQYIQEMCQHLKDAFDLQNRIRFVLDIDRIHLDVSQAVPLGLILNEATTNAIKYAFPAGEGTISISLKSEAGDDIRLSISDDGMGLPEGFAADGRLSLGMSLMKGLTDDLDGRFTIASNHGTTITIAFKKENILQARALTHA